MGNRIRAVLTCLFVIANTGGLWLFSVTLLERIPIPPSLVGYRLQAGPSPTIRIEVDKIRSLDSNRRLRSGSSVTLKINAPQARDMKLSQSPDFQNAPWRKINTNQSWILNFPNNQSLSTVYAVFRYRDQDNRFIISPIVHDSISIRDPHKKITRTGKGYFDWHDLVLFTEALEPNPDTAPTEGKPIEFVELQKAAEDQARKSAYQTLQSIPIHYGFTIGDFLVLNRSVLTSLGEAVNDMHLNRIFYPTAQSVFLIQSLSLINHPLPQSSSNFQLYSHILYGLYRKNPKTLSDPYTDREVTTLIIDSRGSGWQPMLLADVVDQKGSRILTPSDNTRRDVPFIRYLRDLYPTETWKIPDQALVVKALKVDQPNNRIILLEETGKIIRNSESQIENLANGNLYIVTD